LSTPPTPGAQSDEAAAAPTTAAPTRRERQRHATYAEIVSVARRLLREHNAIALRAVAQEMGVTAPALYRYVESHEELLQLVARAVFDDIVAELRASAAAYPDDDPAAQLVVAAVGFRRWALRHPEEFGLIFANPALAHQKSPDAASIAFSTFFSNLYERVWKRYEFRVPTPDELPADVARLLERAQQADALPCDFPGAPVGLSWVFMRAWSRLYGIVTLEVFGHLEPELIASGALFRAMMADNGADLELGSDLQRLLTVVDAEATTGAPAATAT
jgi:AcrR family transcriptional regulator